MLLAIHRTNRVVILLAALAALTLSALAPTVAHAKVEREILSNAEPTDLVNITPIRIEAEVQPGVVSRELVTIFNDSERPVSLKATVLDLGPPDDKSLLAQPATDDYEFGAADWVTSEVDETVLQPFEKIKFDVIINPPLDAPVGSSYAGVEFQFEGTTPDSTGGQVALRLTTMLQVLLNVPGPVKHDLELVSATTRDFFHFGGSSFVSYGVRYRNDGNVTEHVKGDIRITSLFGNEVKKIDLGERALIRGATGTDRATWTDPPAFGIFSAVAEIEGDDGKVHKMDAGRVVLLPPWWVIALVIATLVLPPLYFWWRRRQEWMLYLDDDEDDEEYAVY